MKMRRMGLDTLRPGEQCVLPSCFRQKEEGEWKKRNAR